MLNEYHFDDFYIRHAIDENPCDSTFAMHIHEQCEIYVFISGNVEYQVEGSLYPLEGPCLMLMRPSEVHRAKIKGSEKYERYAINMPISFMAEHDPKSRLMHAFLDRALGSNNMMDGSVIDMDLVKKLCAQMFLEYDNEYDRLLTVKAHILMLLDMIRYAYDRLEKVEYRPRSTSERILAYVNNHLFEPISVPELAKHFYLSPSQFTRTFRQATGASPWEYISKKRLTAAKEKIQSGSLAQEAAEICGFKDYSTFYRAYTKYFGSAPTDK